MMKPTNVSQKGAKNETKLLFQQLKRQSKLNKKNLQL